MTIKLGDAQVSDALQELSDWELRDNRLHRRIDFQNFVEAFGFMTQVAIEAERINHHPEWRNVYRTVEIDLITHEVDGITMRDVSLAKIIDDIAAKLL